MLQAPKGLDRTTINAYEPAEGILDSTEEWRQEAIHFDGTTFWTFPYKYDALQRNNFLSLHWCLG